MIFGYRLCGSAKIKKSGCRPIYRSDHGKDVAILMDLPSDWSQRRCLVQETKTSGVDYCTNLFPYVQRSCRGWRDRENRRRRIREIHNIRVIPIPITVRLGLYWSSRPSLPKLEIKNSKAVVEDVKSRHGKVNQVLVGTVAVETSDCTFLTSSSSTGVLTKF